MAKRISAKDIFTNEDIFKNIRQSAEDTIVSLGKINSEFKKTATTLKSTIGQTKFDSTKSIKEFILLTEKANKLAQESAKAEALRQKAIQQSAKATQELEKIEQQKIKTESANLRLTRQQSQEQERTAKAQERATKTARDETNAYKQLEKATRDLKNQSKELGAQMLALEMSGKKNSAEYRKLSTVYADVTKKAQQGDAQLKKLDQTVGDNFRNVGNYQGAMRKLQNGLSQLGIAFGLSQIVTRATETLVKFDEESANISKTLGVTTEEARKLSMELTKIDTRTSVEALQQIAVIGGQLGIGKKDIVGFTESIDKLNVALGDEFSGGAEEITSVVGGLRNVFSDIKSANVSDDLLKIGNALNILGAEGSATSPVMSDFAGRIAGVGIPLGLTTGQVLGLSATLQELNVSAERGGTAVGGILKKMAENTEGFSKLAGMGASEFANLVNTDLMSAFTKVVEGTKQFNGNAVGLAKTLDGLQLDGAGASEVFLKLANNTALLKLRTDTANESLKQTSSITEEFAKKNDTLGAKIDKLKKAFDVYVLGIDEAGKVSGSFGAIIDFLGKNLGTIIAVLGKVIRTWLIYQGTLKAIQATQWMMNGGFKDLGVTLMKQIPMTRAYRLEQIQLARAQQMTGTTATGAGNAMKTAGNAMKAIPFVLIISLLVELYNWWSNVASASAEARRQADLYKAQKEKAETKGSAIVEAEKKVIAEKLRVLDLEIRTRKKSGESESKLSIEKATREKQIYADSKKTYEQSITTLKAQIAFTKADKKRIEKLKEESNEIRQRGQGGANFLTANLGETKQSLQEQELLLSKLIAGRKEFSDALDEAQVVELEASASTEDYSVNIHKTKESFHGAKESAKEFSTALGEVNDYVQESIDLMQQLDEIFQTRAVVKMTDDIDALIEKTKQEAEAGKGAFGLTLAVAKTPEEEKETDKKNLDLLLSQNTELNRLIEARFELEKKNLELKNNYLKGNVDLANQNAQEAELNKLLEDRAKLLAQDGIGTKDKAKIEADYKTKLAELDIENYQRDEDARLRKKLLDEKLTDDEKKLLDDKLKAKEDANKKILDGDKQFQKDVADANAKADSKELEDDKKLADAKQKIVEVAFDFYKQNSDKKIALLDAEIDASKKQYDYYLELAKNGNISAKESLAEQQKIINEAQLKKEQEQKRQQMMELAKTAYTTYQGKVSSGSKTPLADTIKDITMLQAFIKTIPAFEEGIEDTGVSGRGVDGRGGFHAILHPNERVVPKSLNQQIGDLTNTELANLATNYRAGKIGDVNQSGTALDLAILVNEIKDLKSVIKNKPETNIELGEITHSIMEVVQSVKKGNEVSYNRFKIRK